MNWRIPTPVVLIWLRNFTQDQRPATLTRQHHSSSPPRSKINAGSRNFTLRRSFATLAVAEVSLNLGKRQGCFIHRSGWKWGILRGWATTSLQRADRIRSGRLAVEIRPITRKDEKANLGATGRRRVDREVRIEELLRIEFKVRTSHDESRSLIRADELESQSSAQL
jgi:hypothetical protein